MDGTQPTEPDVEYTSIDLNDTSTTSTIYDSDVSAEIHGVYMEHSGSTAKYQLEVTDGSSTAVIRQLGTGSNLEFKGPIRLDADDSLQINVTTAEGSALEKTAAVSRSE